MGKYLSSRLLQTIPTVFLVTVVVFLMLHLTPGDPVLVFIGDKQSTPEFREKVREDMGLNRPLHVQYLSYMSNALRGDLGRSLQTNVPVMAQIINRLPWTIELSVAALLIASVIGITIGIIAAFYHNTVIDTLAMALALGRHFPAGLLVITPADLALRRTTAGLARHRSRRDRAADPAGDGAGPGLGRFAGAHGAVEYARGAQSRFRLNSPLQRHHRARCYHPARAAQCVNPGGDRSWLDTWLYLERRRHHRDNFRPSRHRTEICRSCAKKDFTVVQGMTLFIAMMYVGVNIVVDIVYAFVDPRIRYD